MVTVDVDENKMRFYLNGEESDSRFGHGSQSPLPFESPLKKYGGNPYYVGVGDPRQEDEIYFAGDIGQIVMWDKALSDEDISKYYTSDYPTPTNTKLYYDFTRVEDDIVFDGSGNNNHGIIKGGYIEKEPISSIPNTTLPYRNRPGRFFSQDHKRNDMVGGRGVHQKDTSINERRFVEEVQGGIINTDDDGLSDLNYSVIRTEKLFETDHEIIDFKCEGNIPDHVEF